jgi:hypothetical protein
MITIRFAQIANGQWQIAKPAESSTIGHLLLAIAPKGAGAPGRTCTDEYEFTKLAL